MRLFGGDYEIEVKVQPLRNIPDLDLNIIAAAIGGALVIWGVFVFRDWRNNRRLRRKGRRAERVVGKELKRLRKRDNIVLNDVLLPLADDRTSQIDHILISRRGIFVIETKSHTGRIKGSEHGQYWQQYLNDRSKTLYNPLLQNRSHIKALKKLLP